MLINFKHITLIDLSFEPEIIISSSSRKISFVISLKCPSIESLKNTIKISLL